jgi:hypothetical protein
MIFYPSRIPDPGIKKASDPGSGSVTLTRSILKFYEVVHNGTKMSKKGVWSSLQLRKTIFSLGLSYLLVIFMHF